MCAGLIQALVLQRERQQLKPGSNLRVMRDCWGWAENGVSFPVHCGEYVEFLKPSDHFASYSVVLARGERISLPTSILNDGTAKASDERRDTATPARATKKESAQSQTKAVAEQGQIPL